MANPTTIRGTEKDYPDPIIRETLVVPGFFSDVTISGGTGTAAPAVGTDTFFQFIPLFVAGSKGDILDFVRIRYDVPATDGGSGTSLSVRYIADGVTPAVAGSSVQIATMDVTGFADTVRTYAIDATNNRIPPNAMVYLASSSIADTGALKGLVVEYGRQILTN